MKIHSIGICLFLQCVRYWETDFDHPDRRIRVDGITFNGDVLSDISFSRSIGNKGLYGVSTSQLSFKVYTDMDFQEGAEVIFLSYLSMLPIFYISSVSRNGRIVTITAYDLCKNLDIPFDYSSYTQFDNSGEKSSDHVMWYDTSLIIGNLANQCGFNGAFVNSRVGKLCYNDFQGKTCRQILDDLSKADCGYWQAISTNLRFDTFSPRKSDASVISGTISTPSVISGTKTITGIHAEDEAYSTISIDSNTDWKHTEIISGRYMSKSIASDVASQILQSGGRYVYIGFSLPVCKTDTLYDLGNFVTVYDANKSTHTVAILSVEYRFTNQVTASFSADAPDNSFSAYSSLYQRQISGKIGFGNLFGCGIINKNGYAKVTSSKAVKNNG